MGVSFWEWVQFLVPLALLCVGLFVLAGQQIPALAGAATVVRKATIKIFLILVDRVGGWVIDVTALALRAAWELLRYLWAGPRRGETVNRFDDGDLAYVPPPAQATPIDPPSAAPSVRPSAPVAPDRPALPPAVERLMVDRSREAVILGLVAAGWNTEQIRGVLKGTNAEIGVEVKQARERLANPQAAQATPVAGRATAAAFPPQPSRPAPAPPAEEVAA